MYVSYLWNGEDSNLLYANVTIASLQCDHHSNCKNNIYF